MAEQRRPSEMPKVAEAGHMSPAVLREGCSLGGGVAGEHWHGVAGTETARRRACGRPSSEEGAQARERPPALAPSPGRPSGHVPPCAPSRRGGRPSSPERRECSPASARLGKGEQPPAAGPLGQLPADPRRPGRLPAASRARPLIDRNLKASFCLGPRASPGESLPR